MGRVGRRRRERLLNDLGHLGVRYGSRPAHPRLVPQARDALLHEAATPLPDRMLMHAQLRRDDLIRHACGAAQNHAAAIRQGARDPVSTHLPLQIRPFFLAEHHRRHRAANATAHQKNLLTSHAEDTSVMICTSVPED